MKLTKHPDADGTFSLLDSNGTEVARGLSEGMADAQIGAEATAGDKASDAAKDTGKASPDQADGAKAAGKPRDRRGRG